MLRLVEGVGSQTCCFLSHPRVTDKNLEGYLKCKGYKGAVRGPTPAPQAQEGKSLNICGLQPRETERRGTQVSSRRAWAQTHTHLPRSSSNRIAVQKVPETPWVFCFRTRAVGLLSPRLKCCRYRRRCCRCRQKCQQSQEEVPADAMAPLLRPPHIQSTRPASNRSLQAG